MFIICFNFVSQSRSCGLYKKQTASIDRIDPDIGYIESNIQWVHKNINKIKTNNKQEDFLSKCYEIAQNHNTSFVFQDIPIYITEKRSSTWKGVGNISGSYWSVIRNHAVSRDLEINISLEYIWDLFKQQGGKCRFTKRDLIFPQKVIDKKEQTASLDRDWETA